MIDTRCLLDYWSRTMNFDHRSFLLAVTAINTTGPVLLGYEHNNHHRLHADIEFLRGFPIYTTLISTQGSIYRDSVIMVPVAKYRNYQVLIISWVKDGDEVIHERFYQLLLFFPADLIDELGSLSSVESEILRIVKSQDIQLPVRQSQLLDLKYKILRTIER